MHRANFQPTQREYSVPTATSVGVDLPRYSREHLMRFDPTAPTAWFWSHVQAVVDAGNGFPMLSGESLTFDDTVLGQTIFVRQTSGGTVAFHQAFMRRHSGH